MYLEPIPMGNVVIVLSVYVPFQGCIVMPPAMSQEAVHEKRTKDTDNFLVTVGDD
jgi:hypothetical protein